MIRHSSIRLGFLALAVGLTALLLAGCGGGDSGGGGSSSPVRSDSTLMSIADTAFAEAFAAETPTTIDGTNAESAGDSIDAVIETALFDAGVPFAVGSAVPLTASGLQSVMASIVQQATTMASGRSSPMVAYSTTVSGSVGCAGSGNVSYSGTLTVNDTSVAPAVSMTISVINLNIVFNMCTDAGGNVVHGSIRRNASDSFSIGPDFGAFPQTWIIGLNDYTDGGLAIKVGTNYYSVVFHDSVDGTITFELIDASTAGATSGSLTVSRTLNGVTCTGNLDFVTQTLTYSCSP